MVIHADQPDDLERLKDLLTSQPALNAAHEIADQYPTGRSIHMYELLSAAFEAVEDEIRNEGPWNPSLNFTERGS